MRRIDWQSMYGCETDAFRQVVVHALQAEGEPMRRKRTSAVLVAALLTVILAATAFAVTRQAGLLEMLNPFGEKMESGVEELVLTDIEQQGGMGERAVMAIREAIYDGRTLHLLIEAKPKAQDTALIWYPGLGTVYGNTEAKLFGSTVLGIMLDCAIGDGELKYMPFSYQREGAGLAIITNVTVPEGTPPEMLTVALRFGVYAEANAEALETIDLAAEIPRTAEPQVMYFTADVAHDLVEIVGISVDRTKLDMTLAIEYKPLLMAFSGFRPIPEDGLVNHVRYGSYGMENEKDGVRTVSYQMLSGEGMPEVFPIWICGTEDALLVRPGTGEVTLGRVLVEGTGAEITVTVIDEEVDQ